MRQLVLVFASCCLVAALVMIAIARTSPEPVAASSWPGSFGAVSIGIGLAVGSALVLAIAWLVERLQKVWSR